MDYRKENIFTRLARPALSAIGDEPAARVAGASNMLMHALAGAGTDAGEAFEQGRQDFKRGLKNARYANPYGAFLSELGTEGVVGAAGGKAVLTIPKIVQALREPFEVKAAYPRRTREQWRKDLARGREEFNKLRARGPLKRPGHPDAQVTGKSWGKIKQGNIPEKYDMLGEAPDVYATGEYLGPAQLNKARTDDFKRFHWYQKGNRGVQVGESKYKRILYNVDPDVEQYLLKHPEIRDLLERTGKK